VTGGAGATVGALEVEVAADVDGAADVVGVLTDVDGTGFVEDADDVAVLAEDDGAGVGAVTFGVKA
jgi:hypothetical protein